MLGNRYAFNAELNITELPPEGRVTINILSGYKLLHYIKRHGEVGRRNNRLVAK